MFDYGYFSFGSKDELLAKAAEYWNPGKVSFWQDAGTPMVIDRREGYRLYDMSGKSLIDLHLNGGTYNFGQWAMAQTANNVAAAARLLGLTRPQLAYRLGQSERE